ncbi:hypothetical protein ACHAWF_003962 [Thalassiosira exigua]
MKMHIAREVAEHGTQPRRPPSHGAAGGRQSAPYQLLWMRLTPQTFACIRTRSACLRTILVSLASLRSFLSAIDTGNMVKIESARDCIEYYQ